MSTTSIDSHCFHGCHLFSAPFCEEQTRLRRVANLVFHIFTLALPLLIYHLCRCCCALDCTRVQATEQDPEKLPSPDDLPPPEDNWDQYRENLIAAVQKEDIFKLCMGMDNADPRWKKDEAIVIAYFRQAPELAGQIFREHVDPELRKNKNVVLAMVRCNGRALREACSFQNDEEVVLAAVQQSGLALVYAHESLKKDKNVVLVAIQKNGEAIQYAHESLKGDKDVVLAAVRENGMAFRYASELLRRDREVVIEAVKQGGYNPNPHVLGWAGGLSEEDKKAVIAAFPEHNRAQACDYLYA